MGRAVIQAAAMGYPAPVLECDDSIDWRSAGSQFC